MGVLVIGGTGYIGTHVVKRLLGAGHDTAILHLGKTNAEWPPDVCHILRNRQRLFDFRNEFRRFAPQVVKPRIWFDHDLYVDTTRIRIELDYKERVSRSEALLRTIDWERANPPTDLEPNQFDYAAEDKSIANLTIEGARSG